MDSPGLSNKEDMATMMNLPVEAKFRAGLDVVKHGADRRQSRRMLEYYQNSSLLSAATQSLTP